MKIYLTLLIAFITSTVRTEGGCDKGCLRCNKDLTCQLCDYEKNYYSSEGKCLIFTKENCESISLNGICLMCNSNYYLDPNTKNCVKVEKPVANCNHYASENSCLDCIGKFVLEATKCVVVGTPINHCANYSDKLTCESCDELYQLTSDSTKCVLSSQSRNCAVVTNLNCSSCQKGYIYNQNLYLEVFFKDQGTNTNLVSFMNAMKKGLGDKYSPSGCEKINVTNCAEAESADKCKKCETNYFLKDDQTCEKNPFEPILQCGTYLNQLHCSKCNDGFWLENPKSCQPILQIDNCVKYNANLKSVCMLCAPTHFLQSNVCNVRTLTVVNCETYSVTGDICSACKLGMVLVTTKNKCIQEIPHCDEYANSDLSTTQLVCTHCKDKNYINTNENSCLPGEVNNCGVYSKSPTLCTSCLNLFFLDANNCAPHDAKPECQNYSPTTKNTCTKCIADHILFTSKNTCILQTDIPFCGVYLNATDCSSCVDGYKLQANTCIPNTIANCLVESSTNCVKCQPGFYIENGACLLYHEYQTLYCAEKATDGFNSENSLNCEKCASFNFPKNYLNQFVCMKEDKLTTAGQRLIKCKKHQLSGNSLSCAECEDGFYIDANNSNNCISCSGTKVLYSYTGTNDPFNVTELPRRNLCKTTAIVGCEIQSVDTFGDLQCLKCATNFVPKYFGRYALKRVDNTFGQPDDSLGVTYPTFTCEAVSTFTFNDGAIVMPPNCLSFIKDSPNSRFLCEQCKFRKTGPLKINNFGTYIDCIKDIVGCNQDYYGGFHFDDLENKFKYNSALAFSCHSCFVQNYIPVNFGISGANWTFDKAKVFNLDVADNPSLSLNPVGDLVQCRLISELDLSFTPGQFTATFVPNCGLAFMHTGRVKNFKTGASDDETSLKCAECKPGFKKILEIQNQTSFVSGCEPILNCDNTFAEKWFNSCGRCEVGFSWRWDSTAKRIRFDECIDNSKNENCIVISDSNPIFCKYCQKGYILNLDGKCEQLQVPKCTTGSYVEILTDIPNTNALYKEMFLIEYLLPRGVGCTDCDTGYLPFSKTGQKSVACTGSPYLASKVFKSDLTTSYVRYCKDYSGNQIASLKCLQCQDNFILNADNTRCLPSANFINCTIVNSNNNYCSVCIPGYILRKLACERALITNCSTYDPNADFQKCNLCLPGFYVSADSKSCVQGTLNNCKIYANTGNCTQCEDGYGLAELSVERQSCIFLTNQLNCNAVDISKFKIQEYKCETCKPGYSKTQDVTKYDPTICLKLNPIANCSVHDLQSTLAGSTLACSRCIDNFYLIDNGLVCLPRNITITNCVQMTNYNQACQVCQPQYYVSVDGLQCLEYPVGIFNCRDYQDKLTCSTCHSGYYLDKNLCVLVTDDKKIANCSEYSFSNNVLSCLLCFSNFFKKSTTECVVPKAMNCLIFETESICLTCPEGHVFQENAGVKDCISQPIPNCSHVSPISKICEVCDKEFYPNTVGKCSSVSKSIANCLVYAAADLCLTCEETSFLSLDQKSCLSRGIGNLNLMENCKTTSYNNASKCLVCKEGHFFINGNCESCLNTIKEGCFACDPSDTSVCLNCISGFYQASFRGKCTSMTAPFDDNNGQVNFVEWMLMKFIFLFAILLI